MQKEEIIAIAVCVVLAPLVLYLKGQAYRSVHGSTTIGRDSSRLLQRFREWKRERDLKKKYEYLNNKNRNYDKGRTTGGKGTPPENKRRA